MKKVLLALALCLVIAGLIATPAFAATQKVPLTVTTGASYATFITNQGDNELVINVTLKGALPNAKYGVYLIFDNPISLGNLTLGSLTTNSKGNWGGQNQQYEFQTVMRKGNYTVNLSLINGPIDSPIDVITSPLVTVKIK